MRLPSELGRGCALPAATSRKLTPMGQPPGQASSSYSFYLVSHCTLGHY